ncbi:MAG: putative capsular polysaccharide synthesis family protein [Colwellia sp.]
MISKLKRKLCGAVFLYNQYRDEGNILIYQMGKVGSTSLENSLPNSIHVHTLFGNFFLPADAKSGRDGEGVLGWIQRYGEDLIKRLAIKRRKEIKIITLVRNPMARDMSMFFQDLPEWLSYYKKKFKYDTRSEDKDVLVKAFEGVYDSGYALAWFDKEIYRLTGIDVFKYPLHLSGYCNAEKGKYQVLVIRSESMGSCADEIRAFTGFDISVTNTNRGESKWYGGIYKNFKSDFKPSKRYIKKVQGSKLYKHFYEC